MPSQDKTHETCRVVHHLCPALHAPTISLASRQSHLSSHLPVTPLATRRLVVVGTPAGETSAPHRPIISSHSRPPPNAAARRRRVSTTRPSHAAYATQTLAVGSAAAANTRRPSGSTTVSRLAVHPRRGASILVCLLSIWKQETEIWS